MELLISSSEKCCGVFSLLTNCNRIERSEKDHLSAQSSSIDISEDQVRLLQIIRENNLKLDDICAMLEDDGRRIDESKKRRIEENCKQRRCGDNVVSQDSLDFASALTKYANSQFKCGCVIEGIESRQYFDKADAALEEARQILGQYFPGGYIDLVRGEIELVGAVTATCRAHAAKRLGKNWEIISRRAIKQFFLAEKVCFLLNRLFLGFL